MSKIIREPSKFSRNIFIDEVKDVMVNNMDCNQLREYKLTKQFNKFITQDVVNKAINRGFPRPSGKAELHEINDDYGTFLNHNVKLYNELNDRYQNAKALENVDAILDIFAELDIIISNYNLRAITPYLLEDQIVNYDDDYEYTDEDFLYDFENRLHEELGKYYTGFVQRANEDKYKLDDLVRGDILQYNIGNFDKKLIYDGCDFIDLQQLPKQFRVLENNVHIDYWAEIINDVNLDIKDKRNELIANLVNDKTFFDINGQIYIIEFTRVFSHKFIINEIKDTDIANLEYENKSTLIWFL